MSLISKEHALEFFQLTAWGSSIPIEVVLDCITNFEEIDAQPVVHGKWVKHKDHINPYITCSVCNMFMPDEFKYFDYCPHCGAKMDVKEDSDD